MELEEKDEGGEGSNTPEFFNSINRNKKSAITIISKTYFI
jgi:hypothetical protein